VDMSQYFHTVYHAFITHTKIVKLSTKVTFEECIACLGAQVQALSIFLCNFQETFMLLVLCIPIALKDNINIPVPSEIVQELFNDGHCYLRLLLHRPFDMTIV